MRRISFNVNRKMLYMVFGIILVSFFSLTIVYAALSVTLNINGNAEVTAANWDIHLENPKVKSGSVNNNVPTISGNNLSFSASLTTPGDYYEFTVDVVNGGDIDAMIDSVVKTPELTTEQAKYFKYEVSYQNGEDVSTKQTLKKGTSTPIKVRIEYRNDLIASDLPTATSNLNLKLTLIYVQSDGSGSEVPNNGQNVYRLGDTIEQGDYRYIYMGCSSYEEFREIAPKFFIKNALNMDYEEGLKYIGMTEEEFISMLEQEGILSEESFSQLFDGWNVDVIDNTKTSYGVIESYIDGIPVLALNSTFQDCMNMKSSPEIPYGIISMSGTYNVSGLVEAPIIPSTVTLIDFLFSGCPNLVTYSGSMDPEGDFSNYVLPNTVTDISSLFSGCKKITKVPSIPNSVTNMSYAYSGTSISIAPVIPNGVTDISYAYSRTNISTAPVIPNSVINMEWAFWECLNLVEPPEIPESVIYMNATFNGCRNLKSAPVIPSQVIEISALFRNCTSLTGDVIINSNNFNNNTEMWGVNSCWEAFKNVDMTKINLKGSASKDVLNLIGSTGNNWTPIQ